MIDVICEFCGGPFRTKESYPAKGKGRFCSISCRSRGGWAKYDRKPAVEARFLASIEIQPNSECHVWTGRIRNGYGELRASGRHIIVHRYAYERAKGKIPDGLVIDHLCRNRTCCNPDHLEAVTIRENTLRGVGPAAQAAVKTHCPHGHPYDQVNTHLSRKGGRLCRACWSVKRAAKRAIAGANSTTSPPRDEPSVQPIREHVND